MPGKSPTATNGETSGAEVVDNPRRRPFGWPAFGDFFESFPSIFNQPAFVERWPEIFSEAGGFETIKVEEVVDDETYVIRAEIPGVDPEEAIDISVDNGRLTIKAERERRSESDEAEEYRSEFHYGSFRRSMMLPAGASADDVKASYHDGILEVRVPIDEEASTKTKVTGDRR